MGFDAYRQVLRQRAVRRVLLVGLIIRIPMWAANVILTLHVVSHLHRSYSAAGVLAAVSTVALAISAPWRGRRLDTIGLRAAILPSLIAQALCWSVAPFVSYWPLVVFVFVGQLFAVPSFTIVRQALIHSVDETSRKSALSIDSVAIEISFMIGPAVGVLLATYVPTSWALFSCQFAAVAGGILLWIANPAVRGDHEPGKRIAIRGWMTPGVVAILAMSVACTVVLTGTDVGIVAALRSMGHQSWIGWELTLWGLGSAVGGGLYGAMHRNIPVPVLLALLSGLTLPVVIARDAVSIAALLFVAGLFCAPTITATVDALSRVVDARVRGEALGWHGAALTVGGAVGAPIAGVAIDHVGWHGGFVLPSLVGLAVAGAGVLAARGRAGSLQPAESVAETVG